MRNISKLRVFSVAAVFTTLVVGQAGYGQAKKRMHPQTNPCSTANLPAEIQNKLTTKYAGWKILTQSWMIEHHGKDCPGLVIGKFSDDNQVSYVLNLIRQKNGKTWQQILYFHPSGDGFSVESLVASGIVESENAYVEIEKFPPQKYSEAEGYTVTVTLKTDGLGVTCGCDATTEDVYYWKKGHWHVIREEP